MDVTVYPSRLSGTMKAPPSKSAAHRALICAGLSSLASGKSCRVWPVLPSEDVEATRFGLEALGCQVKASVGEAAAFGCKLENPAGEATTFDWKRKCAVDSLEAPGRQGRASVSRAGKDAARGMVVQSWLIGRAEQVRGEVNCGESGSTFRFFLPILGALGRSVEFNGRGRLPQRPMEPLFSILRQHGMSLSHPDGASLPLAVSGHLTGGEFSIGGNVSSQYVSGLLFALPLLWGDSRIRLTAPLESAAYVEMTLKRLKQAGITVEPTEDGFFVLGGQRYGGREFFVEGDYSNSAFFLCGAAVAAKENESVSVEGLSACSCQGDRRIAELLSRMGAAISESRVSGRNQKEEEQNAMGLNQSEEERNFAGWNRREGEPESLCLSVKKSPLSGMKIDLKDIPDLGPILAVAGAYAMGKTTLFNGMRLRLKESDRLSAMNDGLGKMGAHVTELPDGLVILGKERLKGGCQVSSANDHRVAMALSIAALGCEKPVVIRQAECVSKSYPHFFEELNRLGGKTDVVNLG